MLLVLFLSELSTVSTAKTINANATTLSTRVTFKTVNAFTKGNDKLAEFALAN